MTGTRTLFIKLRSLLREKAGFARGDAELKLAHSKIAEKNRRLNRLREQAKRKDRELDALRTELARLMALTSSGLGNVDQNIIWIFGVGRTGSTWLSAMMEEIEGYTVWFEPRVGEIFDPGERFAHYKGKDFILSPYYKKAWLGSIRAFVLDGVNARFPGVMSGEEYLVIKEPSGSVGAPLLMEALPESRMIFLVRDPRDVVASALDATREGSWIYERIYKAIWEEEAQAESDPNDFVEASAENYLRKVGKAKEAYDAHRGRKVLVKYEELRADALGTMRRLYSALEIPVGEGELARAVGKHSWEGIPEEHKGAGKFYRKAAPGGWREDLTPAQAEAVERITAPLLEELYPDGGAP